MDDKKILFYTCVNDENLYKLCVRHIRALAVPKGFSVEVMPSFDTPGMAKGYNLALARSDAKYKVYLHQDTFIINRTFLYDVLCLFAAHPAVGLLGVAGCRAIPASGVWWEGRERVGRVIEFRESFQTLKFAGVKGPFCPVQAVDGLIMITQYDLPWREDLFDGFHFYDTSQCLEFLRAGRQVAVPAQDDPWCLHWCGNEWEQAEYYRYRDIFVEHYRDFLAPDGPVPGY